MKKFIQQNKIHVIIWTIGLIFFGFFLYNELTAPSYLLRGFLLNTETTEKNATIEEMTQDFVKEYNIDIDRGDVLFDNSYICEPDNDKLAKETSTAIHEIMIGQTDQTLDFVLGPTEIMKRAMYESCAGGMYIFTDLSTALTGSQLELYEPYFLYVDQDVIDSLSETYKKDKNPSAIELPDMTKPEEMKHPIPVMIDVSNSKKLTEIYGKKAEQLAFAIMEDTPSQALAMNFLEYITLKEE